MTTSLGVGRGHAEGQHAASLDPPSAISVPELPGFVVLGGWRHARRWTTVRLSAHWPSSDIIGNIT